MNRTRSIPTRWVLRPPASAVRTGKLPPARLYAALASLDALDGRLWLRSPSSASQPPDLSGTRLEACADCRGVLIQPLSHLRRDTDRHAFPVRNAAYRNPGYDDGTDMRDPYRGGCLPPAHVRPNAFIRLRPFQEPTVPATFAALVA